MRRLAEGSAWVVIAATVSLGCELQDQTLVGRAPPEPVQRTQEPYSTQGMERVIPIRFVHVRDQNPPQLAVPISRHWDAIARLNTAYRSAGIQFTLYSAEAYHMPQVARANRWVSNPDGGASYEFDTEDYLWNQSGDHGPVYPEFQQITWLGVPADSFPANQRRKLKTWFTLVATKHGPTEAIVGWVFNDGESSGTENVPLGKAYGSGPHQSRALFLPKYWLSPQYGLAHEIGHYLGLPHTFALGTTDVLDPSTSAPALKLDFWDLIFCPGSPGAFGTAHEYYHSRDEALHSTRCTADSQFGLIDTGYNCTTNTDGGFNGFMACDVYKANPPWVVRHEQKTSNDWEISQGLGGTLADPPTTFDGGLTAQYVQNLMSYYNPSPPDQYERSNLRLSPSQIEFVRKTLRYDIYTQFALEPEYAGFPGGRPTLGRRPPVRPSMELDFNGDGRRDLAVWEPPTMGGNGTFKVLLSPNYSAPPITFPGGPVNSIPVAGHFNNDAAADLGWYVPGTTGAYNSQGTWTLCNYASGAFSCGSAINFGEQRDVPLTNTDFDDNPSTGEIALYRPDMRQFFWAVSPYSTYPTYSSRTLNYGLETPSPAFIVMPDDFDGDGRTDMGGWDPVTGKAWAKPVSGSFTYTVTQMPNACVAQADGGTSAARAGCVPVPGLARKIGGVRKAAISVWDSQYAQWHVLWSPGSSTSVDPSCYLGQAGDIPLALDLLPSSPDDVSKLGFFRYNGTAVQSTLAYVGGQQSLWCNYSTLYSPNQGVISERVRVVVVGDMNLDHLPEVVQYDQESGVIRWYLSPNYTTIGNQVTLGNGLAEFL